MPKIIVNANRSKGTINKNIYGQFAEHLGRCIYGGLYVGENSDIPNVNGLRTDVVQALKAMGVPVLRWPGGCFADTYHWQDGIGPRESRKKIVNTNWGGVTEDNAFGTHEFMELCRQLGCEAYFSGNVGSGTVQEFSDWVEYCNMDGVSPMAEQRRKNGQEHAWNVKYWGIGNEAWGCGGNMEPEFYANLARQYATYLRNYSSEDKIYKIASGANVADYHWTKTVMEKAGRFIDAVSLHYYTLPRASWQNKGSATAFDTAEYYTTLHKTLKMEELVENHSRILKQYDPEGRVGLAVDEWGTWYDVEPGTNPGFLYQQNAMRDALVAAINLNIFNNHCDTVVMANIAQMVNVLQAMVLTEGPKMLLTPTYHVFALYRGHQNAKQLESYAETRLLGTGETAVPDLHVSASAQPGGSVLVTVANLSDAEPAPLECILAGLGGKKRKVTGRVLTAATNACNTFAAPAQVAPRALAGITQTAEGFTATLPPCSVTAFTVTV
ncbi:MAG: alpha-L-arabinofuranosidase C-terminal domain-containing protein [Gemmiger sp.]|nr:alpha-L-arabinofuranosidase C-terminal domain-containing protein [Gemmiger sp.]